MSQHDQNIANSDGATVRADINSALAALFGLSSGTSAPSTTVAYQLWADTTNNLLKRRNAANSGWIAVRSLAETFAESRSSNTILGVADVGKTIVASSSFTQTFTAAATLGDGWFVDYINDGTGAITLDPNGAETIDGSTTIVLASGESVRIVCNGSSFKVMFRRRGTSTNDSAAAGMIGEVQSSTIASGSAVSLTTNTGANVTSLSLTAGDWDVYGNISFVTGGTTVVSAEVGSVSTTSATLESAGTPGRVSLWSTQSTGNAAELYTGRRRLSLSSTTTVYLVAFATFATSTLAAYGSLSARRVR